MRLWAAVLATLIGGCTEARRPSPGPRAKKEPERKPKIADIDLGEGERPPAIAGVAWNPKAYPEAVPDVQVAGILVGERFEVAEVILEHVPAHGAFFLGFARDARSGCEGSAFDPERFVVRLGTEEPNSGDRITKIDEEPAMAIYDSVDAVPDLTGTGEVHFPRRPDGVDETAIAGAVSVWIDAVSSEHVEGRVYLASRGKDRSLLVGAFGGRRCPVPPDCRVSCCSAEMRAAQKAAAERLGDPSVAGECCLCQPQP